VDVTIPEDSPLSVLVLLAILYSLLPFLLVGGMVVFSVWTRRLFWCFGVGLVVITLAVNEGMIKRLIQEKRPDGSCLLSFGMPSSHSAMSMGLLTWILCEMIIGQSLIPTMLFARRGWISIIFTFTNFPVPFSRVILKDHSTLQVFVGSGVGIGIAILYFLFLRCIVIHRIESWEEGKQIRFHNDYSRKDYYVISGDVKNL